MSEPQAGQPALKYKRRDTRAPHSPDGPWELIGPADCPIMWRRTVLSGRFGKLLVHRFMPNASDRDCHDHPSPFLTFVLRGGYDDMAPCGRCRGTGRENWAPRELRGVPDWTPPACTTCKGEKVVLRERVRAPMVRLRRAEHLHVTRVGARGALTVVLMFSKRRDWGFWRDGHWYQWRSYERIFGLNWRCDSDQEGTKS